MCWKALGTIFWGILKKVFEATVNFFLTRQLLWSTLYLTIDYSHELPLWIYVYMLYWGPWFRDQLFTSIVLQVPSSKPTIYKLSTGGMAKKDSISENCANFVRTLGVFRPDLHCWRFVMLGRLNMFYGVIPLWARELSLISLGWAGFYLGLWRNYWRVSWLSDGVSILTNKFSKDDWFTDCQRHLIFGILIECTWIN